MYTLYRNDCLAPVGTYDTQEEVWEAIGWLPFDVGYEVRDENEDIVPEFMPF